MSGNPHAGQLTAADGKLVFSPVANNAVRGQ
jgi:hypothetical protein